MRAESDLSSREDKPSNTVKVSREQGDCDFCEAKDLQVIRAIDPRVYRGWACPDCVMSGEISDFAPEHGAMLPMVFVARGLKGEEPYSSLLKSADAQKGTDPIVAARAAQKAREELNKITPNRHERRRLEALERRKK